MENRFDIKNDLKLLIDENEHNAITLANATGVSLRTIESMLRGNSASDYALEAVYSYMFNIGLRLNKVKEDIYKEKNSGIVLFHGSKYGLDNITVEGSRSDCDFGSGFYLGEDYEQAASFVCEYPKLSVYAFRFHNPGLNVIELHCDITWMIIICYFRGTIKKYENHKFVLEALKTIKNADVIVAPIANNKMFYVMQQFADGEITTTQAIHSLAASSLGKQYVFKTKKAISSLSLLERLYLSIPEKETYKKMMSDRGNEIDTKLKMAKREFRGEGQYIDELFI